MALGFDFYISRTAVEIVALAVTAAALAYIVKDLTEEKEEEPELDFLK